MSVFKNIIKDISTQKNSFLYFSDKVHIVTGQEV